MSGPGAGTPVIPETMRAFVLDGTGREHAAVRRVPTPVPGPGQLLGRVDAAGICSSVNKVIGQGPEHSLMYGRDLAAHPAILGDEGAITVVAAGDDDAADEYPVGARYAVQPAVDVPPVTNREWYANGGNGVRKVALGYTLPGLLAEFVLVTREASAWRKASSRAGMPWAPQPAWRSSSRASWTGASLPRRRSVRAGRQRSPTTWPGRSWHSLPRV